MTSDLIPFGDLDEHGQNVRRGVASKHREEALRKLIAVPFHEVVKVDATALARSEHAVMSWWLYPADPERTRWYHPPSNDEEEATSLGACLLAIASLYSWDSAAEELRGIPGQTRETAS